MAITRPVTKTIISTVAFGVPVVDEVNRLTAWQLVQVPTAWTALPYLNGWMSHSASPGQYRKVGDIVYVRGRTQSGTMGQPMFQLPVGFRPAVLIDLETSAIAASNWDRAFAGMQADGFFIPYQGGNVVFNVNFSFSVTL